MIYFFMCHVFLLKEFFRRFSYITFDNFGVEIFSPMWYLNYDCAPIFLYKRKNSPPISTLSDNKTMH